MHALKDLFTSDVGLMSVAGIAFMLGMLGYLVHYVKKHVQEEEAAQKPKRH